MAHRYEVFIAAPPSRVWDTYFIHISKTDYRPGTRVLEAEVLSEVPLRVRIKVQHDTATEPAEYRLTYDVYEPYAHYRLYSEHSDLVEEGEFTAEGEGTRLRVTVTGRRRGLFLPWVARRRVERNHVALKAVCEGHPVPPPRAALPRAGRWQDWLLIGLVIALFLPLPWLAQIPLVLALLWFGARYLWRLALLLRRL